MASSSVPKLYYGVIEDVISSVREAFIDEGVDEQALAELKQVWEKKLQESKAIEREPEPPVVKNPVLQPVQQQTTNIGSSDKWTYPVILPTLPNHRRTYPVVMPPLQHSTITHQLAMPATNLVPQTLLQYSAPAGSTEAQKTMALNLPQKLTLTVPAHLAQSGLQTLVSAPGTTALQFPAELASFFQGTNVIASGHPNSIQHGGQQIAGVHYQTLTSEQLKNAQQFTVTIPVTTPQSQTSVIGQIDGMNDTSDDEDDDDFQDNDDDRDDNDDDQNDDDMGEEDEEPLNSADDVSEDDPTDLFDTENVVVCQYDKITRSKNRWKFHLKDGIMNLQGKDFVFQKALGDSEW